MQEVRVSPPRFIDANCARGGFGFFHYLNELLIESRPPKPSYPIPQPLRRICSIARTQGCNLLIEETLPAQPDLAYGAYPITCRNPCIEPRAFSQCVRLTFFRCFSAIPPSPEEALLKHHPPAWEGLQHDRDAAKDRFEQDLSQFDQIARDKPGAGWQRLTCLGYADVHVDDPGAANLHGGGRPRFAYVHRAVIRGYDTVPDQHYIHSCASFPVTVLEGKSQAPPFHVRGSMFIQQNGLTSSCAHAAVMTALNNLHAAVGMECPVTEVDINRLLGIDNETRFVNKGLSSEEIADFMGSTGLALGVRQFDKSANISDVITACYYQIEAGLPAVVTFTGSRGKHSMAAVGHTFDGSLWPGTTYSTYFYDLARPYQPSHRWVDKLVVQDDNFGPYSTLPKHVLETKEPAVVLPVFRWAQDDTPSFAEFAVNKLLRTPLIGPVGSAYKKTLPQHIREICRADDDKDKVVVNPWLDQLFHHLGNETLVMRTTPCSLKGYLKRVYGHAEPETGPAIPMIARTLESEVDKWVEGLAAPGPFWLVELSIPELYERNHRILGEALVLGPLNNADSGQVCLVRLPGYLCLVKNGVPDVIDNLEGEYHFQLARHSDQELAVLLAEVKR